MGSAIRFTHDDYIQPKVILKGIKQLTEVSPRIDKLLKDLERYGGLILVGGAVRDLAENKTPRDFDIIIDGLGDFEHAFEDVPYKRNRFGGYKLTIDGIEFDIWGISNNWAFKESIFSPRFENVSRGAFFNFDSLCFHIQHQILDCEAFVEAIRNEVLDILLDDTAIWKNPTPEINVLRAWVIHKTRGLQLSERVKTYIKDWYFSADNHLEKLKQAEYKHYGERKQLTSEDYDQLLSIWV